MPSGRQETSYPASVVKAGKGHLGCTYVPSHPTQDSSCVLGSQPSQSCESLLIPPHYIYTHNQNREVASDLLLSAR